MCVRIEIGRMILLFFFIQADDGIRDFYLSRGLGDVYWRQVVRIVGGQRLLVVRALSLVSVDFSRVLLARVAHM